MKEAKQSAAWVAPPDVEKREISIIRMFVALAILSSVLILVSMWFKERPPPILPKHLYKKVIVKHEGARKVSGYKVNR